MEACIFKHQMKKAFEAERIVEDSNLAVGSFDTFSSLVVFGFSLALFAVCFLSESTGLAFQRLAAIPSSSPVLQNSIPHSSHHPIHLLDSPRFTQRQSATAAIIQQGAPALPVLAQRYFESSPETNYRIRKSLEGIAAAGDEETFLKATAILLTLYSNGNERIFQQIEALQIKWRAHRTEIAIDALKRTGAQVAQQKGYSTRFAARTVVMPGVSPQSTPANKIKAVKRTVDQQKHMVESILTNDAESNRDFIFDLMPEKKGVNQALAVGVVNQNLPHLAGTTIKFPADWSLKNPDAKPFSNLLKIDDRLFVELTDAHLTEAQWQSLAATDNIVALKLAANDRSKIDRLHALPSTLPPSLQALTLEGFEVDVDFADALDQCQLLQQLQLKNCKFSERVAERIDGVQAIKSLVCQFEKLDLDEDLVRAMAEFGDLRALYLTAVRFEDAALANMRRLANVSLLYVSDMPATSEFFKNVGAMPRLNNIQFKGCKLDIPAYKRLEATRRVRMNFEAQAFLGIQGSGAMNAGRPGVDTQVSMVIPDSAADEGGVKAGDFINRIDGEKVEDFRDVRLHITQYAAGDEVVIEVLRNGKPESLTVTLRDFDTARKF